MSARPLWLACGLLATGCAIVGALLPLVPTTPFLLLAAYGFARSSPRLEAWLLEHAHFGPLIENWRTDGSIAARTKVLSVLVMVVTLAGSWLAGIPAGLLGLQAVVLTLAALFVVTRPSAG